MRTIDNLPRRSGDNQVTAVHAVKEKEEFPLHVPEREREMLDDLVAKNPGPFSDDAVPVLRQ